MGSYQRLCAAFYDRDKPWASESEVDYFGGWIKRTSGPRLEAMCGSGRLLIPLLKQGLVVEGVDNSTAMLKNLKARCRHEGIAEPTTYLQSLCALQLLKRYDLIFIALGSFQLLSESDANLALANLRAHLNSGGHLVVDTFIPWDLIESNESRRTVKRKMPWQGSIVELDPQIEIDRQRQRYRQRNHYQLRTGETVFESELEEMVVRWYFPEQFAALLKNAGFSVTKKPVPVTSSVPLRCFFEAQV